MQAALKEISETPSHKLNKVDKIWARDVRELSYDIEDKIDTFMVRCKGSSRLAEQHGLNKAIDRSLNWLMQPKIRRKIATDIRDIKSRVLEVHDRRRRYEVNKQSVDEPVKVDSRALVRYEEVTKLVGIDEARDEVIRILMEGNELPMQQDKIVSIVGFGGLGKTTLANVVYEKLRGQFGCSAFVSVSQTPDMEKLLNNLLYQLARRNHKSIDVIIDELRKFLWKKRYLIVIDDIWDILVWKHIRCALPNNNGGCKIITTTRILKVAEDVGGVYKMKPLCLHSSKILLYTRIFGDEVKDKCPNEELEKVPDRILTKCAGVPLAIITIASLLASKRRNKLDWYEVYNSIGTGMENNNTDVENMRKILLLSYYNMPSHLRACFLYLRVFPEDFEVDKRSLIWMWIAEGFIRCGKQGQSLFEVGKSYFNELVNTSMIQSGYDFYGSQYCGVHDLVLDLICSLSSEENFITKLSDAGHTSPLQKARRLSLQNSKVDQGEHGGTVSMRQVRSMIAFSSTVNLMPALSRFEVLRVLHLEDCDLSHGYNLKYIGKLVHLRCLGLRYTNIAQLPEEIGNLQFLHMLDITNNEISTLPSTIVQLRQLKCLYIDVNVRRATDIGCLTSLEELSRLYINDSNGMQELGNLTQVRVLDIAYLNKEAEYTLVDCLHKLQNVEKLSIYLSDQKGILDGWVGPKNLRSLELVHYSLSKLPVWINRSHIENLSFLNIGLEELQPGDLETLGRLPCLRVLYLYLMNRQSYSDIYMECYFVSIGANNIVSREFVVSDGLFPCLVHCKLMGHFERVVFQQGAMPRLTSLKLEIYRRVWSAWKSTGVPDLGFENLPALLDLRLVLRQVGDRRASMPNHARAALRNMAATHPNHPSISVSEWH